MRDVGFYHRIRPLTSTRVLPSGREVKQKMIVGLLRNAARAGFYEGGGCLP